MADLVWQDDGIWTLPVDPFDPFMGQYAAIRYEFTRVANDNYTRGEVVYTALIANASGIYRPASTGRMRPDGDFIKGEVETSYGNESWVQYGIENYYFEKDATFSMQNVTVEARVGPDGRARIVGLMQNNVPLIIGYRNFSVRQ